jgi:hypothetical protein
VIQHQRARWHDNFIKKNKFKARDWALLFDSRFKDFKGKFCTRWLGPYEIDTVYDSGAIKLCTIDEDKIPLMANGHRLHLYHRPISKESFFRKIANGWLDNDLELRSGRMNPCWIIPFFFSKKKKKNVKTSLASAFKKRRRKKRRALHGFVMVMSGSFSTNFNKALFFSNNFFFRICKGEKCCCNCCCNSFLQLHYCFATPFSTIHVLQLLLLQLPIVLL